MAAEGWALIVRAQQAADNEDKLAALTQLRVLLLERAPQLLPEFCAAVLDFQSDKAADTRKFVAEFIEDACKAKGELLPTVLGRLYMLVHEDVSGVALKRSIQTANFVFGTAYRTIALDLSGHPTNFNVWRDINAIKDNCLKHLYDNNDGVRTMAIKFLQSLVLFMSPAGPTASEDTSSSLIVNNHPVFVKSRIEEEGAQHRRTLLACLRHEKMSSTNLTAAINACTHIAKTRPLLTAEVIDGLHDLVASPPSLGASQLKSVLHTVRLGFLAMLKLKWITQQAEKTMVLDVNELGGKTQLAQVYRELRREVPKYADEATASKRKHDDMENDLSMLPAARRRDDGGAPVKTEQDTRDSWLYTSEVQNQDYQHSFDDSQHSSQRRRVLSSDSGRDPRFRGPPTAALVKQPSNGMPPPPPPQQQQYPPTGFASGFNWPRLHPRLIADVVCMALPNYPPLHAPPPNLDAIYQRVPQFAQGLPVPTSFRFSGPTMQPGAYPMRPLAAAVADPRRPQVKTEAVAAVPVIAAPVVPAQPELKPTKPKYEFKPPTLDSPDERTELFKAAFERLVGAAESWDQHGQLKQWRYLLVKAAVPIIGADFSKQMDEHLTTKLLTYVQDDLQERLDVAIAWLYEEFIHNNEQYDDYLHKFISGIGDQLTPSDKAFTKVFLDIPKLNDRLMNLLKDACTSKMANSTRPAFRTLRDVIEFRPAVRAEYLDLLLSLCVHEEKAIRGTAIVTARSFHGHNVISNQVEAFALVNLHKITDPKALVKKEEEAEPMEDSVSDDMEVVKKEPTTTEAAAVEVTEEDVARYLELFMSHCVRKPSLLNEFGTTYVASPENVQRYTRSVITGMIKAMAASPGLIEYIANFTPGAETLILRILFLITDRGTKVSRQLVDAVQKVFYERDLDPRLLVPILAGLHREEMAKSLPKILQMPKDAMTDIIQKISDLSSSGRCQVVPSDVLTAILSIDFDKNKDLFRGIMDAVQYCLNLAQIYKQEVATVTLQNLFDLPILPNLFMWLILQCHDKFPKQRPFLLTFVARVVNKRDEQGHRIWDIKPLWEGFIRYCVKTQPASFDMMLQLPPPQLKDFLSAKVAESIRKPFRDHLQPEAAKPRVIPILQHLDSLLKPETVGDQ